ncbi:MAG TPA: tetratricopeptide repeat protein [Ktedonobacteraceae bacterium]|nr:tetratricopeptide repeat protein [Ktedonobacteraceae bacterium]
MALGHLERHEEALASYEQAIRLDPNDAFAHELRNEVIGNR